MTFLYKCRRCQSISKNPRLGGNDKPSEYLCHMQLVNAIHGISSEPMSPKMLETHLCGGGMGIGDLIGFEKE